MLRFLARMNNNIAANVGYVAELWQMTEVLRGTKDFYGRL